MRRRSFILLLSGTAILSPLLVRAQQKTMPAIGFLHFGSAVAFAPEMAAAFDAGLSEIGYVNGRSVAIEYRWAEGHYDRLPALATDLVNYHVDVIVAISSPATFAAKRATSTIPIVFLGVSDPVANGLIASLARPGGNLTGFSLFNVELTAKRLEFLSELVPHARSIALLVNPDNPQVESVISSAKTAADAKGVQLSVLQAGREDQIDAAFAGLADLQARGLVVQSDPFFGSRSQQLVALASRYAVPAIYAFRLFAALGGLASYGPSLISGYRQAGIYAGRILKGEKPSDLPVQQPTILEFVINLKTAKVLGLAVPQSILARADEVIE
jgi:putative tryptophan/tyrosine transport system substrate-binding protein